MHIEYTNNSNHDAITGSAPAASAFTSRLTQAPLNRLSDTYGRVIDYLRLAVTSNCNLRCCYCMPDGPNKSLLEKPRLTLNEMKRVLTLFADMGVKKLRLTGGEPLVWPGTPEIMQYAYGLDGIDSVHITTNGVLLGDLLPGLLHHKFSSVNISLDTLKPSRFSEITQRSSFDKVWQSIETALIYGLKVKINVVVQNGINDDEIIPFAELAKSQPLDIRFIEEMPFNGKPRAAFSTQRSNIIDTLLNAYPSIFEGDCRESTALISSPEGFVGRVGIIAGFSRSFCGTCNRIRVTANGDVKTCLYGHSKLNLKRCMEQKLSSKKIQSLITNLIQKRAIDGHATEAGLAKKGYSSMSEIGG